MANIEIGDLISVLETIRSEQFPEIPASLLQEIVQAELTAKDDRTKARHNAQKAIDNYLKTVTV